MAMMHLNHSFVCIEKYKIINHPKIFFSYIKNMSGAGHQSTITLTVLPLYFDNMKNEKLPYM